MRPKLPSLPRLAFGGAVVLSVVTAGLAGCGSRGPLDIDDGTGTNTTVPDATASVPPDAAPAGDASVPPAPPGPEDAAAPRADAGPIQSVIECGSCVAKSCGDKILACVASEACRSTFQCVASTCLGSGSGLNPVCLIQCAGKDPAGGLAILDVFTCLTGSCGGDCASILSVLGQLGGLGGGKKIAAEPTSADEAAFRDVMSRWPELVSRDVPPTKQ